MDGLKLGESTELGYIRKTPKSGQGATRTERLIYAELKSGFFIFVLKLDVMFDEVCLQADGKRIVAFYDV